MSTDANARGAQPTLGHIRALDGIRALSVLLVGGRRADDPARVVIDKATMREVAGSTAPGWRVAWASATIDPSWFPSLPCQ